MGRPAQPQPEKRSRQGRHLLFIHTKRLEIRDSRQIFCPTLAFARFFSGSRAELWERSMAQNRRMRHLHDTRAPFWTGIGTGSRARQVQDPNGGSRVRCRFWPHKKALPSSSLSFLAAKKTPYRYPFSAMQTSTRSIKTKGKKPKCQTSVSSLLLRRLEVRKNPVANLKLRRASLVCMAINRRRRRSVKCPWRAILFFAKRPVRPHSWGQLYESKSSLRWFTAVICVRNGFFLIITWQSGVSLKQMPQSPCSVKVRLKHFLSRGINIRQVWPAKAPHHQGNYSRNHKTWW